MRVDYLFQLFTCAALRIYFVSAQPVQQVGSGTQVMSDCDVGEYFTPNPYQFQKCSLLGDCLECALSPGEVYIDDFPDGLTAGMYCGPARSMYDTYFGQSLTDLSTPADTIYAEMTDNFTAQLEIEQLGVFVCNSSHFCPNLHTICSCDSG